MSEHLRKDLQNPRSGAEIPIGRHLVHVGTSLLELCNNRALTGTANTTTPGAFCDSLAKVVYYLRGDGLIPASISSSETSLPWQHATSAFGDSVPDDPEIY